MKYRANPVIVDAFKIVEVGFSENGLCPLKLEDGKEVQATQGMTSRMWPSIGDYWVIQSDGYIYLNPKDVFERKYSPIPEGNKE